MDAITTRWATINDVDLVAPLFDGYRQFYQKPSNLQLCTNFLSQRLAAGESKVAIALKGEEILGFAQLYPLFSSLFDDLSSERVWLLNDLFVDPVARGCGAGVALLGFVQKNACADRVGHLMLETAKTNSTAQSLYERQGWVRDDEFWTYTWRAEVSD